MKLVRTAYEEKKDYIDGLRAFLSAHPDFNPRDRTQYGQIHVRTQSRLHHNQHLQAEGHR